MWQLLDSSSRVHFRSTPLSLPAHTHGMAFPKRSAPWLFTTAPLGGLAPPPVRRHWRLNLKLFPPSQLQHAELYFADVLILGTLCAVAGIHSFNSSGYPKDTEKHQHLQTCLPCNGPRLGRQAHCPAIEYHSLLCGVLF
jgi:hypothetical protein